MKKFLYILFIFIQVNADFLDEPQTPIPPAKEEIIYDDTNLGEFVDIQQGQNSISNTNQNQYIGEPVTSNQHVLRGTIDNSMGELIVGKSDNYFDDNGTQDNGLNTTLRSIKEVNVEDFKSFGNFKIALLVPKKVIGSYANKVSNAILSYFILKGRDFEYEVFDSRDESEIRLINTISKIKSKGYNFVIAPLTKRGAKIIAQYEKDIIIYIPTINQQDCEMMTGNIIYGGIDYKKQIDRLLKYTNPKLAIFSGKSEVARRLTSYIYNKSYNENIYLKNIKSSKINPKWLLKNNFHLQNASIFFNLPLVSSALIISSFRSYDIKPYGIFSTQINYSPLLFNMIQKKDRQNIYIANSIGYVNSKLTDIDKNFGNSIKYDWVVYSSTIGLDYIYSKFYGIDPIFFESIIRHQVKYKTNVMKIVGNEFKKVR